MNNLAKYRYLRYRNACPISKNLKKKQINHFYIPEFVYNFSCGQKVGTIMLTQSVPKFLLISF